MTAGQIKWAGLFTAALVLNNSESFSRDWAVMLTTYALWAVLAMWSLISIKKLGGGR